METEIFVYIFIIDFIFRALGESRLNFDKHSDNKQLLDSTIYLHEELFRVYAGDSDLTPLALPVATLTIAHELIHLLIAIKYGKDMTPDRSKYKLNFKYSFTKKLVLHCIIKCNF